MRVVIDQVARRAHIAEERRSVHRRRVLKGATLSFNNGFSTFECVVRNQCEDGAKLSLAETFALPRTFELGIAVDETVRTARVVWRRSDEMGVSFL